MWRLDAIGISDPGEPPRKEPTAVVQFRDAVYKDKGRYVVPIMLKSQGHLPSTNRTVAETRLIRQLQRFLTQPEVLLGYDRVIREYPKEGHADEVPANNDSKMVYCLPHHAVARREAVTTRVRVVFDASSHELRSPSLNDVLDEEVKLGAKLLQLLLQFRCGTIVLTADICIRPEEQNLLRFLWFHRLPAATGPGSPFVSSVRVDSGSDARYSDCTLWRQTQPAPRGRMLKIG
ncbi:uncharacterized protein LOC135391412 [Ornithodoros turicata]|uniref:uncharacterized protein LOC135391412 n=1 Tax=Ornithodoros turicata TaxID=34597 RepID=UPI003139C9AE